jgi:hypothetical protein
MSSSMSHNSGGVINLGEIFILEFEKFPQMMMKIVWVV